ncbi:MAG: D-aminoacylase [Planctomycetes bacterium]|nr:D-aminoacylase [Planctomycetota bacterium]
MSRPPSRRQFLRTSFAAGSSLLLGGCATAASGPFDLLLLGGTLIDGTGSAAQVADVGIRGDRIVAIGSLTAASATRVLDVRGLVVAPGFLDVHAHSDLRRQPLAVSKVLQGVTMDVCGPDGSSPFPTPSSVGDDGGRSRCDTFVDWAAQHGPIAIDIGCYVGHGTVRQRVLGPVTRAPNADELGAMRDLVRQALEQGALGISSGLEYFPGNVAATAELIELCREAARLDRPYVTHIRNEDDRLLEAVDEAIAIAQRSGAPLLLSHLKVGGRPNWHKLDALLGKIAAARASGLDVHADCYPYEAWATSLSTNYPAWAKEGGQFVARLQDPGERERMRAETEAAVAANGGWDVLMLGNGLAAADLELQGLRLDAAAGKRGVEPFALACDLLTRGNVSILGFGIDAAQMQVILAQPWCMVASDGSATTASGRTGHPRSFGTFPRVLRLFVRERAVLSPEEAIRKMTSLPAAVLQQRDRGALAPGKLASIVVFDPTAITDHADWLEPQRYATGVVHLCVRGQLVVADGGRTDVRPGRVVRA